MTTSQCAVGSDGNLLDASEIQWFHDADDEHPLPPVSSSISVPPESGTVASSEPEVHPFFRGRGAPAVIVAGARRSTRAIRPSTRVTDPNNAEPSTSTRHKRSRKESPPHRRTSRKIVQSDAESSEHTETFPSATDVTETLMPNDSDDDDDGSEYAQLQAMADADHEVNLISLS